MKQISESAKHENNFNIEEQRSLYPREFRNRDLKPYMFVGVAVVTIILLWARSVLSDSGFRSVLVKSAIILPVFIMVLTRSKKLVFVLLPDSIEIDGLFSISFDKIHKVKLHKNKAVISYTDSLEKEGKATIIFSDLNKPTRNEAKPALIQWLHEHNLQSLITEK